MENKIYKISLDCGNARGTGSGNDGDIDAGEVIKWYYC